ncbi:hypothetical protein PMI22_01286 [Pseudomonas sp. GM21]|uniref:hypothetical protein n=1 Tax=Pseudomonas sp. GM21 TaxID=1144325 RepID=UPI0002724D34|nr:hypothetical protein [Pseudomonas sp. GM21]EJM23144.1 hypothetical protein PMI22_01286 [Pseudomonas sp. GM21]
MTIIKITHSIRYHPLTVIDVEVGALIIQGAAEYQLAQSLSSYLIHVPLQLLEAYCDITGQRINMATLTTPVIEEILRGFTAAMAGQEFVELSDKYPVMCCRHLFQAFAVALTHLPGAHTIAWDFAMFTPDATECARMAAASDFQRWYWKGWSILRPHHPGTYLRLAQLVPPYGRDFVENIFDSLERYYRNRAGAFRTEWNHMFDYLGANNSTWPKSTFSTEVGVKQFMLAFTISHFNYSKESESDAKSQIKNWNRFLNAVEECLCNGEIWAKLTSPIKRPPPSTKHGSETKIYERNDGILVQEKLLTTVPLHVTDSQAIDLLFFHIKNDLSTVRKWATYQAEDLKKRHDHRVALAAQGTPIIEYQGRNFCKRYSLADVCATLESADSKVPVGFLCKVYRHLTGEPCKAPKLAKIYGFPVAGSLFPLQCLLVLEHPAITTGFLKRFVLYNQNGHMSGFDKEKRLLIGFKDKKQSDTREQIIELNDTSFKIVQDIIVITSLGRNKLRAQGSDNYRYLFLTSHKAVAPFKLARVTIWNEDVFRNHSGLRGELIAQFSPHSDLSEGELVEFIKRIRLTRIRDSRAVEIFIQTKSSEAMSRALGHENYHPDLLSHYLPDSIMAFIKARWIRIFQKAMVCEAMKDSPHLLRVTRFTNMEELDIFLENHRIQEIPAEAADPERSESRQSVNGSEAVLSIGVPFLASLLSLEAAVKASPNRDRVCGKAEYWSSFADKIISEINNGYNRLLKRHLDAAVKLVDAKKMEPLIYVSTHWI